MAYSPCLSFLVLLSVSLSLAYGNNITLQSGRLSVTLDDTTAHTIGFADQGVATGDFVTVFADGRRQLISQCRPLTSREGADEFGPYQVATTNCSTASGVPVGLAIYAYTDFAGVTPGSDAGAVVFELSLPEGANGTEAQPFAPTDDAPELVAAFPAFDLSPNSLLQKASVLCYGADKAQLFQVSGGVAGMKGGPCPTMSGGATLLSFPRGGGLDAIVVSSGNNFLANLHRIASDELTPATIFYNANRNDTVLCASSVCNQTQIASGYVPLFSVEEGVTPGPDADEDIVPLYFWYSEANQDNWVVNSTAAPPGPGYGPAHAPDGYLYRNSAPGRLAAEQFWSAERKDHMLAASPAAKAWAIARGYQSQGILGYLDPAQSTGQSHTQWQFGVTGNMLSLPPGFSQRQLFVYSGAGLNAAVDIWGTGLRRAYMTRKRDDEDIFLNAMTMWTDNGAATLGVGWSVPPGTLPPHYDGPGSFVTLNWTQVDQTHMGQVSQAIAGTSNVALRGMQMDCWWYPVNASNHPMWCGLDWTLPKEYFPDNLAGLRESTGVPLMLYFPTVCTDGGVFRDNYTWSDTAEQGWLLPVANETTRFFGNLFDMGRARAQATNSDPWPNAWAPPMVRAGWRDTHVAAYETDFFRGQQECVPEYRQNYAARDALLQGIHAAAAARNMTVQLCAGGVMDFLSSLDKDTITQARGSIDYAWDVFSHPTNNGPHNWASADGAWVFWATRIAPSKDNFWSQYRDLSSLGYHPDGQNGYDTELHAVAAILSTSVVGVGDWLGMTDGPLLRRLAREDGILLKPDRPLAPMDAMFGGPAGAARAMPDYPKGARLWATHASVAPEDETTAPELATAPTRRLVSHSAVAASLHRTSADALASTGPHHLQYMVVAVDVRTSWTLQAADLYPAIPNGAQLLYRSFHAPACQNGSAAVASGCMTSASTSALMDISLDKAECRTSGRCHHDVAMWQIFAVPGNATFALLGDLDKYVPGSGYRFRLDKENNLIVVGQPTETVNVTYLTRSSTAAPWIVNVEQITVGSTGRSVTALNAPGWP